MPIQLDRRQFLRITGIGTVTGLVLGAGSLGAGCRGLSRTRPVGKDWAAWIHVREDGRIIVYCPREEMGQGIFTAIGMVVAEELDADWAMMSVRPAPLDLTYGAQITENSDSIRSNWLLIRELGATARMQLIRAAAKRWRVGPATCGTTEGSVIHFPSGRQSSYAQLSVAASALPLPERIDLKARHQFRLVGHGAPRLDGSSMVDGSLKYAGDVLVPGMLSARIVHSPVLGGRVARIDDRAARAVPGMKAVVNLQEAVATVAEDSWSAERARRLLDVQWEAPESPVPDDPAVQSLLQASCGSRGTTLSERGDVETLLAKSQDVISAEFWLAHQAHAAMETGVCVADAAGNSCEIWAPTQFPWATYRVASQGGLDGVAALRERIGRKVTGKSGAAVKIHTTPMGGAFGRRLEQDVVQEAVSISRAVRAPVRLIWNREEDIRNDFYQPASWHRIRAMLRNDGLILGWHHRTAATGPTVLGADFPYDCVNVRIEGSFHDIGVRTGPWRSTAHTPAAFARESFVDELATRLGRDPIEYRLAMSKGNPRLSRVLQRVAERSSWGAPLADGHGRGVAAHPSRGSFVAQVAEVSVSNEGRIIVHKVFCVIDCGLVVNPDGVEAQMQGAIVFGLTAALKSSVTFQGGRVEQGNFDDFELLRMSECPQIDVEVLRSDEGPGGVGEPGVPPIAPAVCNAVFAATGMRFRRLPVRLRDVMSR